MTNSTSTNVIFGGAWCNSDTNHEISRSNDPADKEINEMRHPSTFFLKVNVFLTHERQTLLSLL